MSLISSSNKNFYTIKVRESELKTVNLDEDGEPGDIESQTQPRPPSIVKNNKVAAVNSDKDSSNNLTYCAVFSTIIIVLLIFTLPFIVCDLYYSYNSISCQNESTPIGFDLATWLKVSGFSGLGYLVLAIIFSTISIKHEWAVFVMKIIKFLFSLYYMVWLIIGCVLFWKYLEPSGSCNSSVSDYMWARLIIGLIGILSICKGSNNKDK